MFSIEKICPENRGTISFKGSDCINCRKNPAQIVVTLGGHKTQLCLNCAWDLSDALEETAEINFRAYDQTEHKGEEHAD